MRILRIKWVPALFTLLLGFGFMFNAQNARAEIVFEPPENLWTPSAETRWNQSLNDQDGSTINSGGYNLSKYNIVTGPQEISTYLKGWRDVTDGAVYKSYTSINYQLYLGDAACGGKTCYENEALLFIFIADRINAPSDGEYMILRPIPAGYAQVTNGKIQVLGSGFDTGWDMATINVEINFYNADNKRISLTQKEAQLLLENKTGDDISLYGPSGKILGGEIATVLDDAGTGMVVGGRSTFHLGEIGLMANQMYTIEMPEQAVHLVSCSSDGTIETSESGDSPGGTCSVRMSGTVSFLINDIGVIIQLQDNNVQIEEMNYNSAVDGSGGQNTLQTYLGATKSVDSAIDKALSNAVKWTARFVESILEWAMNSIETVLDATRDWVLSEGIEGAWTSIRNIALSLLLAVIIIIAFANVLQIDLETYGINRIIPKTVIAIILVMTSWVIFQFFFEFTLILHKQALAIIGIKSNSSGDFLNILSGMEITTPQGNILGNIGSVVVLIIILVMVAICGIVLLFSLIARVLVLSFLLAISPLAFILGILPFAQSLQKDWWKNFFKWMFMAPVAVLIIAIGMVVASSTGLLSGQKLSDTTVTSGATSLIGLLILAGSLYFAASLPLKWSGDFKAVMEGWQKFGLGASKIANNKFGGGFLARKSPTASMFTKEHWANRSARLKDAQKLEFNRSQQELANKKWFGQTLVGASDMQLSGMDSSVKQGYKKEVANMSIGQLGNRLKNAKNLMEFQALVETAQEKHGGAEKLWANDGELDEFGDWKDSGNPAVDYSKNATRAAAQDSSLYESLKDADFKTYMAKENLGLTARSAISNDNSDLLGNLAKGEDRKAITERSADFINLLNEYDSGAGMSGTMKAKADKISKDAQDRYRAEIATPAIAKKFETDAKVKLKASYNALNRRIL